MKAILTIVSKNISNEIDRTLPINPEILLEKTLIANSQNITYKNPQQ